MTFNIKPKPTWSSPELLWLCLSCFHSPAAERPTPAERVWELIKAARRWVLVFSDTICEKLKRANLSPVCLQLLFIHLLAPESDDLVYFSNERHVSPRVETEWRDAVEWRADQSLCPLGSSLIGGDVYLLWYKRDLKVGGGGGSVRRMWRISTSSVSKGVNL